jgi:tRNA(Arg) A34 adenosine deaminase TadA
MCLGAIYWARPRVIYYATSKEDAAVAGFDDSFIYDELSLNPAQRQIPAEFHQSREAQGLFNQWAAWSEKIKY